jgi:hypothetical protein
MQNKYIMTISAQPLLRTGQIKIYYDCDDYCDEREMNINLVFNSGHWNFPGILCRPFSNVHYGDDFQKADDLTASASYFLALRD